MQIGQNLSLIFNAIDNLDEIILWTSEFAAVEMSREEEALMLEKGGYEWENTGVVENVVQIFVFE